MSQVSYDDFAKLDLRIAKIIETEPIPGKSRTVTPVLTAYAILPSQSFQ